MDNSHILNKLNDRQKQAVSAPLSNMLVLAGAGSGKTRVLVHRIAWLMEHEHISPFAILAVTFTNKAAHEMRGRIESLHGAEISGMWVGTFHGLAHRLLRTHWEKAKLPEHFQILDSDDQYRLVRRTLRSLNLDETKWPPKQAQWFINHAKEEGKRPTAMKSDGENYFEETMHQVYSAYEQVCQQSGLVDFSELLLRSLELLEQNADIAEHYQNRFKQVLVDEFQDTNAIQYRWLKQLTGPNSQTMAVGDDDQSIYSWRGAKIENIHHFSRDYPDVQIIRLEQNYRSTQNILDAANAVISHNTDRMGKKLWSEGDRGDLITLYTAFNERDEAYYAMSSIQNLMQSGYNYSDVAILYRSNAQSRILEERLLDANIAYRIYGGQKFFERAEIKDGLAYLRLITNRNDDAAFERVVNLPTRGIGNTTLTRCRELARENQSTLWETCCELVTNKLLSGRASSALGEFLNLINRLEEETVNMPLGEQADHALHRSGLRAHYKKDQTEKGMSRVENLQELIGAMSQFKPAADNTDASPPLPAFLAHVALEAGDTQAEPNSNCVNLMTLHAAKGLEYPVVFIVGLEEELFPHKMSIEEPRGLEEERRLCYVGMTRAMKKLYLLHAETRHLYGTERFCQPSRFIQEIPTELLDTVRPSAKVSRPKNYVENNYFYQSRQPQRKSLPTDDAGDTGFKIGQRVSHKKFGTGIILNYEGQGEHTRIQIKFSKHGTKWLVANYAKLDPA